MDEIRVQGEHTLIVVCPTTHSNHDLEARILFLQVGEVAEQLEGQVVHWNDVEITRRDKPKGKEQVSQ